MSVRKKLSVLILAVALSFAFIAGCGQCSAAAPDQEEQNLVEAARQMRRTGRVQLNYKDLEISKFIRFMSELLGENIIVDPSVKGSVSVVSPKSVTLREARQIMISVLEMNSLAIQDMGGYSKVLPLSAGPSTSNNVINSEATIQPGETVTTQVVPLRYIKAVHVLAALKAGLPSLQITPLGDGRSVMLVGKESQLNRAVRIIRTLDVRDSQRSIKIFTLVHASPSAVDKSLNAMAKDMTSKLAGLIAAGDDTSNTLMAVGNAQSLREVQRLIKLLDVPSRANNFHIYKLQNADAKVVAEQLSKILATAAKLTPDAKGAVPASVVPDLSTNSLVFTSTQRQFDSIKTILKDLDIQPKQVLLRGLVAEVNLTRLKSAGIDWSAWGGSIAGDMIAAGSATLGTTSIPTEIMSLYNSLVTQETYHETANGNGYTTTETNGKALIFAYINLLNKYNAMNVLSMPSLMCTDNLQSHLQVGQVIPQLKGSLTDTTNTSAVQNSYEYKDVGLILTVTPHIRSGKLVSLEIEQRVEDVLTTTGSTTPVTSKREIKTNVLASNGQTIIIGGLIREAEKSLKNRVPFFSYIPLIGNLFKTNEKQHEKIDLMIFLTPYIVETPQMGSTITDDLVNRKLDLSGSEKKVLHRNETDYQESIKKQSINKNYLTTQSGDVVEDSAAKSAPVSGDSGK